LLDNVLPNNGLLQTPHTPVVDRAGPRFARQRGFLSGAAQQKPGR
jgi:hypothetical protein